MIPVECYFYDFQPDKLVWNMENCLNYEEVFKNHQFYEAKREGKMLTVVYYVRGEKKETKKYELEEKNGTWRVVKKL